jgi:hypothetical protein
MDARFRGHDGVNIHTARWVSGALSPPIDRVAGELHPLSLLQMMSDDNKDFWLQ